MISLVLLFRKPVPHFFSIEKVFNAVSANLPADVQVQKVVLPQSTSSLKNIFSNLLFTRKQKGQVFHVTGDAHYAVMMLPKKKTILTIHDCVFLYRHTGVKRWFFHRLFLKWPVKACRIVTTISEESKRDIIRFSGCAPEKIKVINNPLTTQVAYTEKEFNESQPVLLFIGSTPNKNLARAIDALKGINCVLDVVGIIPEEEKKLLYQNNITYRQSSKLSDEELAAKYSSCDMLLFPTLFEGFGLPIIEAQKAGRVVLTSNLSPMKEVAANGACLVNPEDVQSIRSAIQKIISDKAYRHLLISNGLKNIKRFEPQKIALEYYQLYKEVAFS